MRRYFLYLAVALLTFGIGLSVYGQNSKQRSFFIELQPDSPLLIRNLTATILPVNRNRTTPSVEVAFYVENISKKKVKQYSYQDPAENDSNYNDEERGFNLEGLLPGESDLHKLSMTVNGESLVYRIKEVEFEDGTKWKAKPFNVMKAKKSAQIVPTVQKIEKNEKPKRTLTREWSVSIFSAGVVKVIDAGTKTIAGIEVQRKIRELKSERFDEEESCPLTAEEQERIDKNNALPPYERIYIEIDYIVEKFTTYEIKGRIFAYVIPFAGIEAETGDEIGVGYESIFVDEDGSGMFKLRCDERELKSLPRWVKMLAESN